MANRLSATISYARATAALRRPGRKLVVTHLKTGPEYSISPDGGRVTPITAKRLLERCRAVDAGLFPGIPQAWRWGR
jgi:hypothetical protein